MQQLLQPGFSPGRPQVLHVASSSGGVCNPHPPTSHHRAARHLMAMQQPNGDWPQQAISGVFNHNCMITYANYRCAVWARGEASFACTLITQTCRPPSPPLDVVVYGVSPEQL